MFTPSDMFAPSYDSDGGADSHDILAAGEQFPAMIAAALRHYFGLTR